LTAPVAPTLPTIEGVGLTKTYGPLVALDHVDVAVYRGEVLAVVGDNGSGKSTLIRCLSGAAIPDDGVIRLEGAAVRFRNANDARIAGINTVFQTLAVEPALDIASSLFRSHELSRPGHVGHIVRWLEGKGLRKPARGLASKVIMLDEPTAALGERESTEAMKFIDNLRRRGLPILVASHNLSQVFRLADRIHVQRQGKRAAVVTPENFGITDVLAIMSGELLVDEKDQALGSVR
jgi:fructose transport system ATP-binding protein